MKRRHSSGWIPAWVERETSYRKMCEDLAYHGRFKIVVRDGIVYKVDNNVEVVLIHPINPRSMWFETWCALRGQVEPPGS